jgi:hypothetical protein
VKLWTPGQDRAEQSARPPHVPEEVYQAVAQAIAMGPIGRMQSSGMKFPHEQETIRQAGEALIPLAMVIRKYVDSRDQFDLLMATAKKSGDMVTSITNMAARAEQGTLIKPNSSDWSHRAEALAKGNISDQPSRAERRRWAALQRKRGKQAQKIGKKLK